MAAQIHELSCVLTAVTSDLQACRAQLQEVMPLVQKHQPLYAMLQADADRCGMFITDKVEHIEETCRNPHAIVLCNVPPAADAHDTRAEARLATAKVLSQVPGVTMADVASCSRLTPASATGSAPGPQQHPRARPAPMKVVLKDAKAKQKIMQAQRSGGLNGAWAKPFLTKAVQRTRRRVHGAHTKHLQRLGVRYHWREVCDLQTVWPDGTRQQWRDEFLHLQEVPAERTSHGNTDTYTAAARRGQSVAARRAAGQEAATQQRGAEQAAVQQRAAQQASHHHEAHLAAQQAATRALAAATTVPAHATTTCHTAVRHPPPPGPPISSTQPHAPHTAHTRPSPGAATFNRSHTLRTSAGVRPGSPAAGERTPPHLSAGARTAGECTPPRLPAGANAGAPGERTPLRLPARARIGTAGEHTPPPLSAAARASTADDRYPRGPSADASAGAAGKRATTRPSAAARAGTAGERTPSRPPAAAARTSATDERTRRPPTGNRTSEGARADPPDTSPHRRRPADRGRPSNHSSTPE